METELLPGMVRRQEGPADKHKTPDPLSKIAPLFGRPVIIIATASITDSNIFNNGLFQNCFVIYRLAEAIGYLPIFCVNEKPKQLEGTPEFLRACRFAQIEDILKTPLPIKIYIEIGMSIASNLRRFMKMMGAKVVKLYLGNILNIDIETTMYLQGVNFSHHVIGEQDEIWTSPHYQMNLEYAACLNKVDPGSDTAKIVPYVWDPCILTNDGKRNPVWKPRGPQQKPCFLIMEPNISFQKCSLIPILLVEEFARKYPHIDFDLIVLNSDRFLATGHFNANIEPSLRGLKGKIKYAGRHDMISVMTNYPNCFALCHHINNEFNYMVLEFLHASFPVLHNCTAWKDFGYYYPENDVSKGAEQLYEALTYHHERIEAYKGHSKSLQWRHSIYNPEVQGAWLKMLE
jgi:hypothetical protein